MYVYIYIYGTVPFNVCYGTLRINTMVFARVPLFLGTVCRTVCRRPV